MSKSHVLRALLDLPASVELEGSSSTLRDLAEFIRAASRIGTSIRVESAGRDDLHEISVRQSDGLVSIHCSSGVLSLDGAKDKLEIVADNIAYVAQLPTPEAAYANSESTHIHIEHYEGHPYLAAGSITLVISRCSDALL